MSSTAAAAGTAAVAMAQDVSGRQSIPFTQEQEAAEPELEPSSFDPHRDFYAGMEDEDPSEYPQEPWDDDYSDYDPVDMYAAEWENYAMRDWD